MFLDCRFHTWHEAETYPFVNVLDGKIYVATGAKHLVYDLKESRWDEEESDWSLDLDKSPTCVIDDVLYRLVEQFWD